MDIEKIKQPLAIIHTSGKVEKGPKLLLGHFLNLRLAL